MSKVDLTELKPHPHRRFNPLLREWVQVSPHRTQRPWQGQVDKTNPETQLAYDPSCYLCPGNERAGGVRNPKYEKTFVFENDFAALLPNTPKLGFDESGLMVAKSEQGICRVLCFSPRHDLTVARMKMEDLRTVVDLWIEQYISLGAEPWINYVLIFENRGAMMGASNPHPHGQLWANATVPNEPAKEQASLLAYREEHGDCLLCSYLRLELQLKERVVCENEEFAAIVPFWAVWPFEIMVLSKRHLTGIDQLKEKERTALAHILKRVTVRYDNVFQTSFPYSMGFHQRPTDSSAHDEWHFHVHFFPPLLRSATVRKFMVGYEMFASPQRDITAESAASRLREVGEEHYLES